MVETALDGGVLQPASLPWRAPESGDHWLALAARDAAGNVSPIRWIWLRVDGAPPAVTLATEPGPAVDEAGGSWLPPNAVARAVADDGDGSGVAETGLAVNGSQRNGGDETLTAPLPAEGSVRIESWAVDVVGNRGPGQSMDVRIDGKGPRAQMEIEGAVIEVGDVLAAAPGVRVVVTVGDEESGLASWQPLIDGAVGEPSALAGPWPAGPRQVVVTSVDRVGNRAETPPFRFTVDAEPPEILWQVLTAGVEGEDGETWRQPPVRLSAQASDTLAGVDALFWSEDGGEWLPVEGDLETSRSALRLKAVDRVGNARELNPRWRYDFAAPALGLTLDGEPLPPNADFREVAVAQLIEVELADAGCGLGESRYSMDGVTWKPAPDSFIFYKKGEYELRIEAVDRLGNRASQVWRLKVVGAATSAEGRP